MAIKDLTDKQIKTNIQNYLDKGVEIGGKYSLSDLRLELSRRIKSPFPPREVARAIVKQSKESADGLVSYKQIWEVFRPNTKWIGNNPRSEMAKALGRVIAYCVDNNLPILTTLVVRSDVRDQSDQAVQNICNEARELGVNVGLDARAFVAEQQARARNLTGDWLND